MQEYPNLKSHLKLFGNTIKSINQTLIYQPKYLQDTLVEQAYKLKQAKLLSQEAGMTAGLKLERWSNLRNSLFKTLFGLLYSTRVINLVSVIQLSLTGQRILTQEFKKAAKQETQTSIYAMLEDRKDSDDEEEEGA